ncbi:MAG: hypothetical protein QOC81_2887 [Thermoanaerobaculia bacterium]|jgi:hypothetical protein|nr:hypothetical protein [Thermoanaerobaculia bacterium]
MTKECGRLARGQSGVPPEWFELAKLEMEAADAMPRRVTRARAGTPERPRARRPHSLS